MRCRIDASRGHVTITPMGRRILQRDERVHLRRPTGRDAEAYLRMVKASRALHEPWLTPPGDSDAFAAYIRRQRSKHFAGFLIIRNEDDSLAGVINMSGIIRGVLQSAFLGYYANVALRGNGYMTHGLRLVIRHAFTEMELHRLEASVQPGNKASIALVKRCGFRKEGFSPRYLKIGGKWRDHERYAITVEDWQEQQRNAVAQ